MAYYPNNFYQNYQYGGYPQMSQISQSPMVNSLQGKVVDGVEIVKATDVPFGSGNRTRTYGLSGMNRSF